MGLSPELQGYAENIWRRFPAEFISLGSPDLEEFFELCEGGALCHRVMDTKSEKVIEIVLPRRDVPRSPCGDEVEERCEDNEDPCDGNTSVADFEAALNELDALNEAIGLNSERIPEHVAREVRSQLQTLQLQRAPRHGEDQLRRKHSSRSEDFALSPGSSPFGSSTHGRSPLGGQGFLLNGTPALPNAQQNSLIERRMDPRPFHLDEEQPDQGDEGVDSPFEDSPSVSPLSSHSPDETCLQGSAQDSEMRSLLAARRRFFLHPVITSGLRKISPDSVCRAPHLDRKASIDAVPQARPRPKNSPSEVFVGEVPAFEAWRRQRDEMAEQERSEELRSCSPPDVRRRTKEGNSSTWSPVQEEARGRGRARRQRPSADEEGSPDSPGALIARNATSRRLAGNRSAADIEAPRWGAHFPPESDRLPRSEPSSPAKKRH